MSNEQSGVDAEQPCYWDLEQAADRQLAAAYQAGMDGDEFDLLAAKKAISAAVPKPAPQRVPDGWKLVPVERSYDQRAKALIAFNTTTAKKGCDRDDALQAVWEVMLAAAPAAPQAEPQQPAGDAHAAWTAFERLECARSHPGDAALTDIVREFLMKGAGAGIYRPDLVARRRAAETATGEQPAVEYPPLPAPAIALGDNYFNTDQMRVYADATVALRKHEIIGDFLTRTGQYVTNDASREAAIADAVAEDRAACATPTQGRNWWRKRADEIELEVAKTGSREAMACYTQMRGLIQAVAAATTQVDAIPGKSITRFNPLPGLGMNPAPNGMYVHYRDHVAALAAQGVQEAEPVAYCDLSDADNLTAFAWPGTDKKARHSAPLYAHPPRTQGDAERIDWLERHFTHISAVYVAADSSVKNFDLDCGEGSKFGDNAGVLRAAIDAAAIARQGGKDGAA